MKMSFLALVAVALCFALVSAADACTGGRGARNNSACATSTTSVRTSTTTTTVQSSTVTTSSVRSRKILAIRPLKLLHGCGR